jgi:hypothetical protein
MPGRPSLAYRKSAAFAASAGSTARGSRRFLLCFLAVIASDPEHA